jgi:cytoskeletal protein RodZ
MAVADLLRDARERRGLTLEHLAHETKIPVDRLAAFEDGRLSPNSGFYHRAQIRAYAQALSLNELLVLEELNQELAAATPTPLPQTPQAPARRLPVLSLAVAVGCVMAVAFLGGTLRTRQPQPARTAGPLSSVPGSDRTEKAVRVVRHDQTAPPAIARASLAVADVVERAPVPAAAPVVPVAPAIPTVPAVTQLVIATKPEGARVTVDGIGWGVTPVTIRHLSEGLKRIRVTADGYAAVERVIEIQPDRANRVSIQLRSLPRPIQPAP